MAFQQLAGRDFHILAGDRRAVIGRRHVLRFDGDRGERRGFHVVAAVRLFRLIALRVFDFVARRRRRVQHMAFQHVRFGDDVFRGERPGFANGQRFNGRGQLRQRVFDLHVRIRHVARVLNLDRVGDLLPQRGLLPFRHVGGLRHVERGIQLSRGDGIFRRPASAAREVRRDRVVEDARQNVRRSDRVGRLSRHRLTGRHIIKHDDTLAVAEFDVFLFGQRDRLRRVVDILDGDREGDRLAQVVAHVLRDMRLGDHVLRLNRIVSRAVGDGQSARKECEFVVL